MSDPLLTDRFVTALRLTHGYHLVQLRKQTEIPYFSHLLQVAGLVLEAGGDEDQAIAGLLHDAVEDADSEDQARAREEEIRREFGDRVLALVRGCTDGNPSEKRTLGWVDRKVRYIEHLSSTAVDPDVLLVSVCDKLHNAHALLRDFRAHGEPFWGRFAGRKIGTLWYYRALVVAYRSQGFGPYVDELDRLVATLEREAGQPEGVGLEEVRAAMAARRAPAGG